MELGTVFKSRFRTWQILTLIRMGVVLVAWFIVSGGASLLASAASLLPFLVHCLPRQLNSFGGCS